MLFAAEQSAHGTDAAHHSWEHCPKIRNLPVIEGEPLLEQARVVRRRNLSKESDRKPVSKNFRLKVAQVRLLETLDEIENGVLELITFRDGLPCELEECSQ